MTTSQIEKILTSYNSVAIVGFSHNHQRPSNRIGRYMKGNGFKVMGVNPGLAGREIDEINCYASLKELPEEAEIINIFRRSEFVYDLMNEILLLSYKPKVIWTQIGVVSSEAKELALKNDIEYIENKCIMVEHTLI
ncbi:MAG: CoA-binding protein [bacterium]